MKKSENKIRNAKTKFEVRNEEGVRIFDSSVFTFRISFLYFEFCFPHFPFGARIAPAHNRNEQVTVSSKTASAVFPTLTDFGWRCHPPIQVRLNVEMEIVPIPPGRRFR